MLCARFFLILCLSLAVGYGRLLFLVNRASLWSIDDKTFNRNDLNGSLEYRYIDGDAVNISCVSLGRSRVVKLNYYLEEYVSYDMIKPYNGGVGLRTTLQRAHDRTNMSCEYFGHNYKMLLNVTFILQNTFDDVFYLKINGYTLRHEKNKNYAVYYLYGESLQMECKTNDGDISLETLRFGPNESIPKSTNKTSLKMNPKKDRYFRYVAMNTSSKHILREIDIRFEQLHKDLIDNTLLKLNTTSNNTLINLYAYNGSQLIYYGHKEGDSLSLNCSTDIEFVPGTEGYYLNFDGTEERNKSHIIKHLQLTAANDNTTITCRLLYEYNHNNSIRSMREIHVLFRMRFQGDTFGQQNQTWIVAVVGAAICIVFVACAVVCYMKTRNDRLQEIGAGDTNLDDRQYDHQTSVKTCSTQPGANYVYPIRQTHEDTVIYSNTPVSTSQEEQTTSDLNYAVLDISQPGRELKNSDIEESPYADIYHDANAFIYTNVPYKRRKDD